MGKRTEWIQQGNSKEVEHIKVNRLTGKLMGKRKKLVQEEVEKIKVKGLKEIHIQ